MQWTRLVRPMGTLLAPSIPLLVVLALYVGFKSTLHFFLHTLMGWNIALIVLIAAAENGRQSV